MNIETLPEIQLLGNYWEHFSCDMTQWPKHCYESTSLWIHVDVTFEKDCYSMIISFQYSKSFQNRNILNRDWGSLYFFCKKREDLVILVTFKSACVCSCCFPGKVRSEKEAVQPIPTRERAIKTHPPYHNLSTL